jgi:hypothetical protein
MYKSGTYRDESRVTLVRFTFDVGTLVADKLYWTTRSQDDRARQGEQDKRGKDRPLVTPLGHPRKGSKGLQSRATRPRHDLYCPEKDQKTASPWPGAAREWRLAKPDKACQAQPGEQATHLRPYMSSWGSAEACTTDMGGSSLPELSH